MKHDYTPWLGLPDEPPHGCLRLAERVFRECYGIDVATFDGVECTRADRAERLHQVLIEHARPVSAAQEGDLVILRALPVHIGIVVDPARHRMLHSFAEHHSCISEYGTRTWRQKGFYRWVQ